MRRSAVFQQKYYADDGIWMETQAQQQSYTCHEESWSSDNNYHKRFPARHMNKLGAFAMDSDLSMSKQHHGKLGAMHMNRLGASGMDSEISMSKQLGKLGGSYGMFQEDMHMHSDHGFGLGYAHHGGGRKSPLKGNNSSYHALNGGGGSKFNSGVNHEYSSKETDCEEVYTEEHVGTVTAKVEETRYQQQNWGGDTCYISPYNRNKITNINWWTPNGF
ncbi:unnamed protein product [Sphenostylis stenocarpa]|uniref:Uncharacterized protein n=1 Tax=Sphenostylis stenocarpa TaxID=92480 RepID=A0AA86RPC0_9FABA|nr:unnamed protein product [Sphenostylis stenocarpa]